MSMTNCVYHGLMSDPCERCIELGEAEHERADAIERHPAGRSGGGSGPGTPSGLPIHRTHISRRDIPQGDLRPYPCFEVKCLARGCGWTVFSDNDYDARTLATRHEVNP